MFAIKQYEKPASLSEAVKMLQMPEFRLLCGGTDLLVRLRKSMEPACLIDISGLPELLVESIGPDGTLRLGAGLSFARVGASALVRTYAPILAEAALSVAGPQIRNMGTLGGNICNGAASADSAAPLLALDARLRLCGPEGERIILLNDFYLGPGKVDLRPAEILLEIHIPPEAILPKMISLNMISSGTRQAIGGAWHKYAMRRAMDIATIGCAAVVRLDLGQPMRLWRLRLAFSVAGPRPLRCPTAEEAAQGLPIDEANLPKILDIIRQTVLDDLQPRDSWRAAKDFREQIIRTLAARVVSAAILQAASYNKTDISNLP